MTRLKSPRDIIDALGGAPAVAAMFGKDSRVAYNWCVADKLPAHTYVALQEALSGKGLTAPAHLWNMTRPVTATRADRVH